METDTMLSKIKLGYTFLGINQENEIINDYRKLTQPYLGPHPNGKSDHIYGFVFYITTSSHTNNGKPVKECEGYPHLPYELDEIFVDEKNILDWYDFGLSEYLLDKITLNIPDNKIKSDLNKFMMESVDEYKKVGLKTLNGYEKKLIKIEEFIIKRIGEYRKIIRQMIKDLQHYDK